MSLFENVKATAQAVVIGAKAGVDGVWWVATGRELLTPDLKPNTRRNNEERGDGECAE